MPIYEYECPRCGERFSLLRPMGQAQEPAPCPKCREEARRVISQFATAGCGPVG